MSYNTYNDCKYMYVHFYIFIFSIKIACANKKLYMHLFRCFNFDTSQFSTGASLIYIDALVLNFSSDNDTDSLGVIAYFKLMIT